VSLVRQCRLPAHSDVDVTAYQSRTCSLLHIKSSLMPKYTVLNLHITAYGTRTSVKRFYENKSVNKHWPGNQDMLIQWPQYLTDQGQVWLARADTNPIHTCQISSGLVNSVVLEWLKSCQNATIVTKFRNLGSFSCPPSLTIKFKFGTL